MKTKLILMTPQDKSSALFNHGRNAVRTAMTEHVVKGLQEKKMLTLMVDKNKEMVKKYGEKSNDPQYHQQKISGARSDAMDGFGTALRGIERADEFYTRALMAGPNEHLKNKIERKHAGLEASRTFIRKNIESLKLLE